MASEKRVELSDREKTVLAYAWAFMKPPPNFNQINLEGLAEALGYTNPRSLYPVITGAKKKLTEALNVPPDAAAGPSTPSKPSARASGTPASRKRKATTSGTPSKGLAASPTKGAKRGKQISVSEPQGSSEEDPIAFYDNDPLENGEA